ncbi:MAG: amino acid adenylation domain-containing protein [Cyanobacteria bacterium P01_G01_bin.38]
MIYLLSQILDRSAEQLPEREAFRCEGKGLTYAELACRANGLAHWLVMQGVQRGDRVGIYLSKSLESAIALYGIWKAGAAYVPLDPSAPLKRTVYAINHCGIRHLITQKSKRARVAELLPETPDVSCVIGLPDDFPVERPNAHAITYSDWADIPESDAPPTVRLVEQDLAYIMYTSGSTGTPKGMMHTHRSGLSYAKLAAHTYGLHRDDRLGNHSPLHFDISTLGFFAGPLVSATTVIIPEAYTKVPASLSQLIQDEALTVWYSVPFALIQLLLRGVLAERDLSTLRWVLFAGETFPAKHLYALMQRLPQARFSNIYGPAETNQCSYYHIPPLATGEPIPETVAPIGQIWANSEERVVNDQDQPVPPGDVGELLVRTPTMMSGYWQRSDLNEKVFYECQIANQTARFYRTGDLVYQLPDGNYQFIGRKDRQIKTRGYRVELDEVEATLVAHPQVEEAATYAAPHEAGSQQIKAAVILKSDAPLTETDLKRYLAERLPAYAVPSRIEIAATFPRTGTGKIDRRAIKEQALTKAGGAGEAGEASMKNASQSRLPAS